ncbi:MAG TPA: TetR/AcrR family transcriptional regulator [Polyangiaceae bacterium]|jgi:TetR/AcrR family transcriptional repressor of nem operon|nr:TetR/AcrR family transcriptional regulator [Polyangiaceae bacterium]
MGRPRLFDLDGALSRALDVFWEHGYGATTPAELLDAIGVGKGSFYNAFESKHALFEQALRRYGDDRVAGLSRSLADSGPVGQRIRRYLERLAAPENEKALRRGCFAANTAAELGRHDPAASKIVLGTFERMESVLQATLAEGQKRGELEASLQPKAVASLLLATLIGITVLAKVDSSPARTKRIAQAFAALL